MASGKTHTYINCLAILVGVGLSLWIEFDHILIVFGAIAAIFGTIFLSPDLDLKQSSSQKAWGWFRWVWYIYHRSFSHRKSSHYLVIGTFIRLVYLLIMGLIIFSSFTLGYYLFGELSFSSVYRAQRKVGHLLIQATKVLEEYPDHTLAGIVGLIFADAMHVLVDIIHSKLR